MIRTLLFLVLVSPVSLVAGIPEPDAVFYGRVTIHPSDSAYDPGLVAWSLFGNAETVVVGQSHTVFVNGEMFYFARIPFETRQLADNTPLPATPNTIAITPSLTTYTRTATVDGRTAYLPPNAGTFTYGVTVQGLVERIDLVIGESYNEWSQRYFGLIASGSADPDGDGLTNYQEYLAGTDPTTPQSTFRVKSFVPVSGGGYTFTWDSIVGRTYTIERTADLQSWAVIGTSQAGTGAPLAFTDFPTGGARKLHYRIKVVPSQP